MKMNHECTRIDTKTDGPSSTTSGTRMLLQSCALGVTMSWDESLLGARASRPHNDGFLGARASRPHKAWHGLGHLPHLDQPGTAPWLSFGPADAVPADRVAACSIALKLSGGQRDRMRASRPHQAWHSLGHLPHLDQPATAPWLSFGLADAVPADRVAACSIALKLGGGQRDRMRAGRPRSQAMPFRRCGGEWKPGRQAREQGSGTIGDVCLSPYRGQPDSSRRNSWVPEGTDSGESPLFITFGTVVTVSSAIADRRRFGGCRAWRLRPCREKGGPDVKQNCNRALRVDG